MNVPFEIRYRECSKERFEGFNRGKEEPCPHCGKFKKEFVIVDIHEDDPERNALVVAKAAAAQLMPGENIAVLRALSESEFEFKAFKEGANEFYAIKIIR